MRRAPEPADKLGRPAIWPIVLAYPVGFFLAQGACVGVVLAVAVIRAGPRREQIVDEFTRFALSSHGVMVQGLINAVVLATVAVTTARCLGKDIFGSLRLRPSAATTVGVCAAATGMLGIGLSCGAASELLRVRGHGVMELLAKALLLPTPAAFIAGIVAIAVAPAIAEETFFRWGRWPAIVATSAAFGLFHIDPVQGVAAFVSGLFLGWTAERCAGVRPTIVAHATNNALFVTVASFAGSGDTPRRLQFAVLVLGALLFALSTAVMRSRAAVRER